MTPKTTKKRYADPVSIRWGDRVAKRHADAILNRQLAAIVKRRGRKKVRILSTPAADWEWEIGIASMFPGSRFECVGIEQDSRVHAVMRRNALRFRSRSSLWLTSYERPFSTHRFVSEFWPVLDGVPFDVVYMDWMGAWSTDKLSELVNIAASGIVAKGGFIRFTVGLARGREVERVGQTSMFGWSGVVADIRHGEALRPIPKAYEIPQTVELAASAAGASIRLVAGVVYSSIAASGEKGRGRNQPEASYLFRMK